MRSLVVVTVLFLILLAAIFFNSFFIISETEALIELTQSLPPLSEKECLESLILFENRWNKFKKAASFTVSYSELNRISCLISELYVHLSNKNEVDFDHGIILMLNYLSELPRFEQISTDAIF